MDRRFLQHYNTELQHLRSTAAEFAREFPKIAGRLALDRDSKESCPDPFVERLLEGVAFLSARVQVKLDAEFPRFTQSLLETVYPHYLSPTPSMAVVRFEPDPQASQLVEGYHIPRGTRLTSAVGRGERTSCEYRTAHDVRLWPIELIEAQYYTRDVGQLDLPREFGAKAAIRLRLRMLGGAIDFRALSLDQLTFNIRGADETPVSVYEQLFARAAGFVVQSSEGGKQRPRVSFDKSVIRAVGFTDEESLLPHGPRSFQGYRLLREYFAFPQRFLFFELCGLRSAVQQCGGYSLDIIIALRDQEVRLEGRVDRTTFDLFCTPAINLFPRRADRIPLTDRFSEFHVVPDRTRPLDFEVFEIQSVTGYGTQSDEVQEFTPFYLARDFDLQAGAFFATHRTSRILSEKEKRFGQVSTYPGSEVYLSLVDAHSAPYRSDLKQLGVSVLCTNRHLPIQIAVGLASTDFLMEEHAPVNTVRCVTGPTAPHPSHAEGDMAWRIISHLSLNYLSLLDEPGQDGAVALRDILRIYTGRDEADVRRRIDGIRSTQAKPVVRRVTTPGPIAFARGLEVSVLFDEAAFEGTGVFILGAVLANFFTRYVSLNSFTETVIRTQQRGEIMRWPPNIGKRPLI
jgi:type VI secretion system protein ImpG